MIPSSLKFQVRKELEKDLEGELDLSGVEGRADRSEEGACEEWLRSWQEVHPIEEIEELGTQLDREPVRNRYVPEDGEVYVCEFVPFSPRTEVNPCPAKNPEPQPGSSVCTLPRLLSPETEVLQGGGPAMSL